MSSWLERQASSHHFQLAATAVISGAAVASLIYGGQAIRRKTAVDELKASIPELDESHHSEMVSKSHSTKGLPNSSDSEPAKLLTILIKAHKLWNGIIIIPCV